MQNSEIEWFVPVKTPNTTNGSHGSFMARAKMKAEQKEMTLLFAPPKAAVELPCVVMLTRVSTGKLDDHDNLPISLKHVADGVSKWIGVDDRDSRVMFSYAQELGKRADFGVRIRIVQSAVLETVLRFVQKEPA